MIKGLGCLSVRVFRARVFKGQGFGGLGCLKVRVLKGLDV